MTSTLPSVSTLTHIASIAKDLKELSQKWLTNAGHRIEPDHVPSDDAILPPNLLPTRNITPQLLASGASPELSQRLAKLYHGQFQRALESIERAWTQLASSGIPPVMRQRVINVHVQFYERQLEQWASDMMSRVRSLCRAASGCSGKRGDQIRVRFNYEYLPYLEKYFEENAFPSHSDKVAMAKKSMMNYRQIDVWFQNRRSRAKKEGKSLKRLSMHEEPKTSFDELESLMGNKIIPENERVDSVDPDVSEYEWQYDTDDEDTSAWTPKYPRNPNIPDILDKESPPHAFPSAYPPLCDYDPFPVRDEKWTFPPPVWMRHPAKSIERRPMMDFDEFTAEFAKMSVREGPRKRLVKKRPVDPCRPMKPKRSHTPPPRPDRSAATLFITTRPPPAPLPALIRSPLSVTTWPSSAPPTSGSFHIPNPPSRVAKTPPPTEPAPSGRPTKKRKVAPLPRRSPASTFHRNVAPSTPKTPTPRSPPSHSPPSRTSSFGSDYSSRTSLSLGSSTSDSSAIATPESSPTSLPVQLKPLSTTSGYDAFQNVNDLFGDSPTRTLSLLEGFRYDLSPDYRYPSLSKDSINAFDALPPATPVYGQ